MQLCDNLIEMKFKLNLNMNWKFWESFMTHKNLNDRERKRDGKKAMCVRECA